MSLEEIYSAAWFAHDFEHLQPEFDVVANAIYRQFAPTHLVDIGCGPGMVIKRMRDLGVEARGVEGSSHGIAYAHETMRQYITHGDITDMRWISRQPAGRQVVVCTEVAEHLEEKHAEGLVRLLCSAMCPIIFTAAPPGQDGHHHVHLREQRYWADLFLSHGAVQDWSGTWELSTRWSGLQRLSHMAKNVMIFR